MNNNDVPEGFDFEKLAGDMTEDTFREQCSRLRTMVRVACEAAAGTEADAIEAGIDKRTAKAIGLCVLFVASGGVIAID